MSEKFGGYDISKKKKCNLVNATNGGEGVLGHKHSLEQRKLISNKTKEAMKNLPQETKDRMRQATIGQIPANIVKVIDHLGNIYESATEAGKQIGAFDSNIIKGIKQKRRTNGYSFSYYTKGMTKSPIHEFKQVRAIICNETQVNFPSISEAARQMDLNVGNLGSVLKGRNKTCMGYTFSYTNEEQY